MKKKIAFSYIFMVILFSSCSSRVFQITTLKSNQVGDNFKYKNQDIELDYDFWSQGGVLYFTIRNNQSFPLFLDWKHSNFIFNGYSYDYFNDGETISTLGVYSSASASGYVRLKNLKNEVVPVKLGVETGSSLSIQEKRREKEYVQIPPNSYITAKVVNIDFPYVKTNKSGSSFNFENSILKVRSYIAYSKDKERKELTYVDNEFYVSDIESVSRRQIQKNKSKQKFYTDNHIPDAKKNLILFGIFLVIALLASN